MTSNIGRFTNLEESDLRLIMLEPLEVQATTIDTRVRKIEAANKRIYTELGILCLYVEEKKLFGYLFDEKGERFTSMEGWLVNACPYSRSYALDAKAKIKILRDSGTPMDQLLDVPRCNIQTLTLLPPKVLREEPSVIEDAKVLSEEAFRGKMSREYPEAAIEPKKKMIFDFEASAREVVDEAIAIAMKKWDCGRQAAVEGIFGEFLINNRSEPESNIGRVQEAHA